MILKFKGDIILNYIRSLSFDEMITLESSRIPEEFREQSKKDFGADKDIVCPAL